jgi:hypothetical protein
MQIARSAYGRHLMLDSLDWCRVRRRSRIRAVFSALVGLVVSATVLGGIGVRTDDALAADSLHWSTPRVVERGSSSNPVEVAGVSCPSVSLCVGFDSHGALLVSTDPFGQGRWQVSRIPGQSVLQMTCPSVSLCVASTYDPASLYISTDPAGGAATFTATPIDLGAGPTDRLQGVSCPSASFCVAVDTGSRIFTTNDPSGGPAGWSARTIPGPFGQPMDGFSAISCASTAMCVVSLALSREDPGRIALSTDPAGDASAWTISALPAHADSNSQVILQSLSCPTASLCVAGTQHSLVTSTTPAAGVWTVDPGLTQVSWAWCESATLCFASGDVVGVNPINKSLLLMSTDPAAGRWSSTPVDPEFLPNAVSCPSPSQCIAVGSGSDPGVFSVERPHGAIVTATTTTSKPRANQPPALQHRPIRGTLLSCLAGSWTGTVPITLHDDLLRDGRPVRSATRPYPIRYYAGTSDRGHTFTCRETATNAAGSTTATSGPFTLGNRSAKTKTSAPTIVASCPAGPKACTVTIKLQLGGLNVGQSHFRLRAGHRRHARSRSTLVAPVCSPVVAT